MTFIVTAFLKIDPDFGKPGSSGDESEKNIGDRDLPTDK